MIKCQLCSRIDITVCSFHLRDSIPSRSEFKVLRIGYRFDVCGSKRSDIHSCTVTAITHQFFYCSIDFYVTAFDD